jgi:hypothetical protein
MNAQFLKLTAAAILTSATLSLGAERRDPMGELANFYLDKDSARTSSMVTAGTIVSSVDDKTVNPNTGEIKYVVNFNYDITLKVLGNFADYFAMSLPDSFFTPAFMEKLRTEGAYNSPDFKIRHEGRKDVQTLDGTRYAQTDVVMVSDIKFDSFRNPEGLVRLLAASAGLDPLNFSVEKGLPMTDLKIRMYIYPNIPALGAVKMDLTGKIQGIPTKSGFDYKP